MKQFAFEKNNWNHRYSHGGTLRKQRAGRKARPLSTKEPIHLVLKANRQTVRGGLRSSKRFRLIQKLLKVYSAKFHIKLEQVSIQSDHIHCLIRISRRGLFQNFLRLLSGQVAQRFAREGLMSSLVTDTPDAMTKLWRHRPFTRVIRGWKAYKVVRDYIQLNEKEARGDFKYTTRRLKGLSPDEWEALWT